MSSPQHLRTNRYGWRGPAVVAVVTGLVAVMSMAAGPARAANGPTVPGAPSRDEVSLQAATARFGPTAVNGGIVATPEGDISLVAHRTATDAYGNNVGVTGQLLSLPNPGAAWVNLDTIDIVDVTQGAVSCTCSVANVHLTGATDFLVTFAYADAEGVSVVSDVGGGWFPVPFVTPNGKAPALTNPTVVGNLIYERPAGEQGSGTGSVSAADDPGFSALDPSIESLQDASNDDVKAWKACGASDPLLSQLDAGPDAAVTPVFGEGQNPFGGPALSFASIDFTATSASEARTAFAVLAGSGFQRCLARSVDANDTAEGISPPISPATVASLPATGVPGGAAFDLHQHLNALGVPTTADSAFSFAVAGTQLLVLLTAGVDQTFPESDRLRLFTVLAGPSRLTAYRYDPAAYAFTQVGTVTCSGQQCSQQDEDGGDCAVSLSGSITPTWVDNFDDALKKAAYKRFTLPASVPLRYGFYGNLTPAFEVGDGSVCLTSLFTNLFFKQPSAWDNGTLSFGAAYAVKTGGTVTVGPYTYTADDTAWTNCPGCPEGQPRQTSWVPKFTVKVDLGLDYSLKDKQLNAGITIMELDFVSLVSAVKLEVNGKDTLEAELGPTLALQLNISKHNLEEEIAKELAEDNDNPEAGEKTAVDEITDQAVSDTVESVKADGEGFFGMTPAQIEAALEDDVPNMRDVLEARLNAWLNEIGVGSVDADVLAQEGVTSGDAPSGAAAALNAAEDAAGGGETVPCLVGIIVSPEDAAFLCGGE